MKRSEMLQIITELIYMDDKFEDTEIELAEDLASDILFVIERAEMLPPLTDKQLNHISPMDFKWEPEND